MKRFVSFVNSDGAPKVEELEAAVESITLDKELAEEERDLAKTEVETLKEQMENMQLDHELAVSQAPPPSVVSGPGVSDAHVKEVEEKNEKLMLALTRLRDISLQEKTEFQARIRTLEKEVAQIPALKRTFCYGFCFPCSL